MAKSFLRAVILFAALAAEVQVAVSTNSSLPGPCLEWVRNDCRSGTWACTSVEEYEQNRLFPPLGCPIFNVEPPTPPPGQCRLVNGTCQYAQPTVACDVWVPDCDYRYTCGTVEERERTTNTDVTCGNFGLIPPTPDTLCIPVNDTCQWYNPCRYWRGFCSSGYQCGTLDQYYQYILGPQPLCARPPEGWVEPQPPGECVVQNQECRWSNCEAYLDWCRTHWTCGTQYDKAVYLSSPPPPCPAPPPDYMPPAQPGVCRFNLTSQGCHFQEAIDEVTSPVPTATVSTTVSSATVRATVSTPVHDDACILGIVTCPQDHACVPYLSHRPGAVCVRQCASNNGGCGDQMCVEKPYCNLCELRTVMKGYCVDREDPTSSSTSTQDTKVVLSESHSALGTVQIVGVVIGVLAGAMMIMIIVLCVAGLLMNYHSKRESGAYKSDEQNKYSELKFQDSVTSLDRDNQLSYSTNSTADEEVKEDYGNNVDTV